MDRIYKVGSLFAGIGGICLGFQQAKLDGIAEYELEWANEIDSMLAKLIEQTFPIN